METKFGSNAPKRAYGSYTTGKRGMKRASFNERASLILSLKRFTDWSSTVILCGKTMSYKTLSIKQFRNEVNSIDEDFDRNLVKIAYLTAARASELCNKTSPFDLLNGNSRPYGQFMEYALKDYEVSPREDPTLKEPIITKAFVITAAVAKRGKRIKKGTADDNPTEATADDIREALTRYNQKGLLKKFEKGELEVDPRPVSYTHLTLPTILLV